jgi:hypothetical protein
MVSLALGTLGLLLVIAGALIDPRRTAAAYLVAYMAALGITLGMLALVMLGNLMRIRWLDRVQDIARSVITLMPLFVLLFIPVALAMAVLYPWVDPSAWGLETHAIEQIDARSAYLNVPFFLARAAMYFVVWTSLAWLLTGNTAAMRTRLGSAIGLPLLVLTASFAAFDWLMALSPTWYSTIYGLYVLTGGVVGALALLALVDARRSADERAPGLGAFLLTCVVFWAYLGFSQLLIVWIANIPEEITWYVPRLRGSWALVGLLLIAGHFAMPFLALLSYRGKRDPRMLAAVGAWLLVMHYVDVYWLVLPELHPAAVPLHWLDPAALAAVGGVVTAFAVWRWRHAPRPALEASGSSRALGYP